MILLLLSSGVDLFTVVHCQLVLSSLRLLEEIAFLFVSGLILFGLQFLLIIILK